MAKQKSSKSKRTNGRSIPWRWIVCGILLVLLIIGGVIGFNSWTKPGRELEAELARIRSAKEPTTLTEGDAWFQALPGDPALGQMLLEVGQDLRFLLVDPSVKDLPIVGLNPSTPTITGPWPTQPAAEALLQRCAPQMERLLAAAKQPGYVRLPISFQPQSPGLSPEAIKDFRSMTRMLNLRALVQAHQNDWTGFVDSLNAILTMVYQLEHTPDLLLQLVRCAMHGVACNLLAEAAPHAKWSLEDIARLEQRLATIRFDVPLKQALIADRTVAIEGLRDPGRWVSVSGGPISNVTRAYTIDQLWYLQRSRRIIGSIDQGWAGLLNTVRNDQMEAQERRDAGNVTAYRYYCTLMAFPATEAAADGIVRTVTRQQATLAVLRLLRLRLGSEALPTSVEQLTSTPDFPRDPVTNAPLKITLSNGTWLIYGVGPNQKDDQGAVNEPAGQPRDTGYRISF